MSKPETKFQQVLGLMKGDVSYQHYFFVHSSSLKMFDLLKQAKYFEPETMTMDSKGFIQYWYPLGYLERVAKLDREKGVYSKDLLEIIKSTVEYSKNIKKINNFYIWWGFVKIINDIPSEKIKTLVSSIDFCNWLKEFVEPVAKHNPITNDISGNLLNKFLNDPLMVDYAEEIFKAMIGIIRTKKDDSFLRRNEVQLIWDDHWLWQSFEKNKDQIISILYSKVILYLANKFRSALEYEHRSSWSNITVNQNYYRVYVNRVMEEDIPEKEIVFKQNEYKCFVKKYSDQQPIDDDVISSTERLHIEPEIILPNGFIFTAITSDEMIASVKEKLPKDIELDKDENYLLKLNYLYKNLYMDYSSIWFKSIEHGVGYQHHADELLGMMLREFLLKGIVSNFFLTKNVLERFLTPEYQFRIYRRLVLFLINKNWNELSYLFPVFLNTESNPLAESEYELELFEILENHYSEFDPDLKRKIKSFILDVPEYYREKGGRYEAYWKYKWLSPLSESDDYKAEFSEAKQKAGITDESKYEPERIEDKGRMLVNVSPMSKEEILNANLFEITKLLKEFNPTDEMAVWNGKPDRIGLAYALTEAAKENPDKFINELTEFVEIPSIYIRHILLGVRSGLTKDKEINWLNVVNFIINYLENPNGYSKQSELDKEGEVTAIYLVSDMLGLMEVGIHKKTNFLDEESILKIEKIFDLIYPHLESETPPTENRDVLEYVYRSSLGKVARSYIECSIAIYRFRNKPETNWGSNKLERFFNKGYETSIWFGVYLFQIQFLDKNYVEKKVAFYLSLQPSEINWQVFMQGYLEGSYVPEEIYNLMRPLYLKVLENNVFHQRAEEKLVVHFCIGYLLGWESLDRSNANGTLSLFRKLIDDANTPVKRMRVLRIPTALLEFDGEEILNKNKPKIKEYWDWISTNREFVKKTLLDNYEAFLSRSIRFLKFMDKIDGAVEDYILLSVPYADHDRRIAFLIEDLARFEDEESLSRIGKIFKEILKYSTPTYDQEDIKKIVKKLCEFGLGKKNKAVFFEGLEICSIFGDRGAYFLEAEYKEYENKWSN